MSGDNYIVTTPHGEFVWFDAEIASPKVIGHYLVCQRNTSGRPTRWVRYWNGENWSDSKADRYGEIVCWMYCPPVPEAVWRH